MTDDKQTGTNDHPNAANGDAGQEETAFNDAADQAGRRPGFGPPFTDLPEKILAMLRATPAGEVEHHIKAMVAQAADKLDLVSREEFDMQQAMVERLRERVEQLEAELAARSERQD